MVGNTCEKRAFISATTAQRYLGYALFAELKGREHRVEREATVANSAARDAHVYGAKEGESVNACVNRLVKQGLSSGQERTG